MAIAARPAPSRPPAPRDRPSARGDAARGRLARVGWLMLTLLTAAVLWRGWEACSISLLGWTPIDRCPVTAMSGRATLDSLAATPLLRVENHRAGLALATAADRCHMAQGRNVPDTLADLAGCWWYVGPGQSVAEGDADGWRICLDGDGQGEQRVTLPGGVACVGPVTADWIGPGTAVVASVGDTPCDDGSDLFQVIQQCQWTDRRTGSCIGAQPAQGVSGIPGQLVPLREIDP